MSMGTDLTIAMGNLSVDAKQYRWSQDTINGFRRGRHGCCLRWGTINKEKYEMSC